MGAVCLFAVLGCPSPWTWIDEGVAGIIDQLVLLDVVRLTLCSGSQMQTK